MVPLIIVNFKTYKEATGQNAIKLAKMCESAAGKCKEKARIIIAVQPTDISKVAEAVNNKSVSVYAQHLDNSAQGKFTGHITAEAAKEAGAVGTLLNHAEHKLAYPVLETTLDRCRENEITTVVCAADRQEAGRVAKLKPDCIAIELPELIGTLKSVSTVSPEAVTNSLAAIRKTGNMPVLCGAGVANGEDVRRAIELGTEGILVATAVVLAKNPEEALLQLISGI